MMWIYESVTCICWAGTDNPFLSLLNMFTHFLTELSGLNCQRGLRPRRLHALFQTHSRS